MRLAYFSPFNPQLSGISDYSEELLPCLARYAEIDLFYEGPLPTNQQLTEQFAVYPISDFPTLRSRRPYDTSLYHMGNSHYHTAIFNTLRQYPGITVLHEYMLHHFFLNLAVRQGDWSIYWRELAYHTNATFMRYLRPQVPAFSPELPLTRRVIDLSLGVIVHSRDMARRVLADAPQTRVAVAPMGMPLPPQPANPETQAALRRCLNLPAQAFIVGLLGHLAHHKRLEVTLHALAHLRQQYPEAICLMVGQNAGEYDLPGLLQEMGLEQQAVIATGFVAATALSDYIQAADVWVNLRYPVYGETSAALLRLLAHGLPVIVSDVPTFADLPDDACIRVGVNAAERELLYRYLLLLAQRPELRRQLGHNARRYIQASHTLEHAAGQMVQAIQQILAAVEQGQWSIYHE
ncbi:MAG: glycosyltransferase [Chloroflexi bacterium]|nr:glycosyltransferase [Chloroflexota bacterium]